MSKRFVYCIDLDTGWALCNKIKELNYELMDIEQKRSADILRLKVHATGEDSGYRIPDEAVMIGHTKKGKHLALKLIRALTKLNDYDSMDIRWYMHTNLITIDENLLKDNVKVLYKLYNKDIKATIAALGY